MNSIVIDPDVYSEDWSLRDPEYASHLVRLTREMLAGEDQGAVILFDQDRVLRTEYERRLQRYRAEACAGRFSPVRICLEELWKADNRHIELPVCGQTGYVGVAIEGKASAALAADASRLPSRWGGEGLIVSAGAAMPRVPSTFDGVPGTSRRDLETFISRRLAWASILTWWEPHLLGKPAPDGSLSPILFYDRGMKLLAKWWGKATDEVGVRRTALDIIGRIRPGDLQREDWEVTLEDAKVRCTRLAAITGCKVRLFAGTGDWHDRYIDTTYGSMLLGAGFQIVWRGSGEREKVDEVRQSSYVWRWKACPLWRTVRRQWPPLFEAIPSK